ncbi:AAA family ATPase [Halomonas almeriensis]|uniref:AAA family ATPase n=1 Tax=Halomonas almeriensis TaxID=308163 RepID=UPI0025B36ED4|nr:AAA family ATPase [Halomonas almeriensis]MDN3552181.1 AAA family ATPase [Halomonas almeriensis]
MKILALRLENLASLPGPLELDFTAEPLAHAGLFAITGPTGAGKSTLLDALCLALYGNTPRLRQAPNRDSQVDDPAGDPVTTSDPRTLLRRGTASGHAEVDFVGRDGRRYRARWAVRRARYKAEGRLQSVDQSLRDLDDDRLLTTQKREFDKQLPERLGLTFEQFTRAVLLAQSEFSAFLKADDNERSDLLERLTGTAEYSAISRAAYRRASEAKRHLEALENRLADDLPADPETRAQLEHHAREAGEQLRQLEQQRQQQQARQAWHETDARLREALDQGRHQQQQAEHAWQALAGAREDQAWRRVILPQRHLLQRQADLPDLITRQQAEHAQTLEALGEAEATLAQQRKAHETAEQALQAAREARQQAEPALREARRQATDLASLQQQVSDKERLQTERQQQVATLDAEHRQAEREHQQRRQQQAEWQATLSRLIGDHANLEAARQASRQAFEQAAQRQLALEELASRWQQQCRASADKQRLVERLQQEEPRLKHLLEQGQEARRQLEQAQSHQTSVSRSIERSRAVRSESVIALRDALTEGEPCSVCGGLEHPWRHQPPATPEAHQLAAQQQEEERQLQEAQDVLEQAQQQRDRLFSEYSALDASLKQARQEVQTAEQTSRETHQVLEQHSLYAELASIEDAQRDAWLSDQVERSHNTRRQHESTLKELSQAEQEIEPLKQALQEDATRLARFETRRESLDGELRELAEQLPPLQTQRDELAERLATLLGQHASADAWQQHLDEAQASAYQARDNALATSHQAHQEVQRLTQQRDHQQRQLDALGQESDSLASQLTEWRQAHPDLDDATLTRLLAQSEAEAERQEQQLNDAEQARQQAAATLAERYQALIAQRRDQALLATPHDEAALLGDDVTQTIVERFEALEQERQALTPQLESAQKQRDDAQHALRDDERRRERQQQGQAQLEAARQEYRRWGRISELIGSADGKTFRRIAQAYNLEQLLEHANAHLHGLSRRYQLVRGGSELGLLVIDRDMGDERRSVHSLSGGETFLVSLALALGLASMASGELVIESLFIDEGFGSLDPDSLALAMDALDGLQALGRRVGVISHVQEMHERIPVQIHVSPEGNGTSRATLMSH